MSKLFRLVHYFDVWGNAKDGYEVNNLCEEAILEFKEDPSEMEVLKKLKEIGFIKKSVRRNSVYFDHNCSDMIEINTRKGIPFCRLENLEYKIEKYGMEEFQPYHKEYCGINIRKVYEYENT